MNKHVIAAIGLLLMVAQIPVAHAEADPYRLNPAVQPLKQRLEMTIDPNQSDYSGSTHFVLDVREAVESIVLHAQNITILGAKFGPKGEVKAAKFEQHEHSLLHISTGSPIEPGKYHLRIDFEDNFNTDSVSMYRVEENDRFHVITQMEASEAREAFPCFDEPAYKFPWQVTLTVPSDMMAISNTPIESTVEHDAMKTVVFSETAPIPSYLIAIAVGEFEAVNIPGMSIPGRVVTTPGKSHLTKLAVESTPKLLAGLENYFDTKYPYQKLDLIATPEFWYGAMENPGAIVYIDRALLIDMENVDPTRYRSIVGTNSHELAHQWFGDVVTMEWWVDLWLNESFASWMGDKIVAEVYPQLDIEKSRMSTMFRTMNQDAGPSARPIRAPRKATDNFLNDIGPAYSKGRVVINMFEKAIGEENFRAGILEYMDRHQWGNASAIDFADAIGIRADWDVAKAFGSFMQQPGVPLIDVEALDNNRLSVSQRRFANAGVELPELQWTIPIAIKYSVDGTVHTQTLVLDSAATTIELEHHGKVDWLYPNAEQGGYFRWKVPAKMLQPLVDDAQHLLTPMERMGLVSNLTATLYAGELPANDYLAALASFSAERDPYVLDIVVDQLSIIEDALVSDEHKSDYATFVGNLLGPALESLGLDPVVGESNAATTIRPYLLHQLVRDARDEAITAEFARRGAAYLAGDLDLHASLISTALLATAISGDMDTYVEFKNRFESAMEPDARTRFLTALSYFDTPEILVDLQAYSISDAVRPSEMLSVRSLLLQQPENRDPVLDYALANYETFKARLPGNGLAGLPSVARSCSLKSIERAREFFSNPDHQVSGTLRVLDKVTASAQTCATLRARELQSAAKYFESVGD
ncbi:MAG: M1 family metallopeptidase [Gammaproteobacteria bacterium]|nr:M1 family metallopeptidase [Gammaproteobacteria bacterium]